MALFTGLPASKKHVLLFMAMLNFGSTVAMQGWTMLYNNFVVNAAGLNAAQSGLVQGLREIPGLLGVTLIFFLFFMKEHKLAALSVMAAGLGTMLTGCFPSFVPIIFTSMLMSFGYHYFEAMNNSLAIQHFDLRQTPIVMGRLRGLVAGGSLMISVFVFFFSEKLSFVWLFFVPGAIGLILGFLGLVHPLTGSKAPEQRKRVLPQKRYWLFYVLNFLMGGRRIVFSVFAVFLMVEQFGFSVRSVSLMFMFNYTVNWLFNPMVGKIINRLGERRLMTIEYIATFLIFTGYALTRSEWLIVLLYVFDSLTFNFSIAVRTFFQKIAFPEDAAPNMAIAQTINHIPAVTLPAIGGWMWTSWGYQSVFLFGAGLTAISLMLAQLVDREIRIKNTQNAGRG
ncbi:MFS transporter [Mailhella sp.]|uniref:MFS transporter n=1 Tax=Mailhella sp. TaxID=1981029 RepID=UPI003AB343C1